MAHRVQAGVAGGVDSVPCVGGFGQVRGLAGGGGQRLQRSIGKAGECRLARQVAGDAQQFRARKVAAVRSAAGEACGLQ